METIKTYIQKELPGFAKAVQLLGTSHLITEVSTHQQ